MPRRYRSRSKRKVSRRKKRVSRRKSRTKRKTRRTKRIRGGSLQAKAEAEAKAKALAMQQDAAESLTDLSSDPTAAEVLDMEEDTAVEEGVQRKFLSKIGEQRMSAKRDDTIAHIERTDLEAYTVPKLRQMCHDMGFITTGLKEDLVARLLLVPRETGTNSDMDRDMGFETDSDTDRDMGFETDSD